MKKNTGRKNVIRAIALALATLITATSVPVYTYAENTTGNEEITVEDLRGDISREDDDNPGVSQSIENAQNAVNAAVADPQLSAPLTENYTNNFATEGNSKEQNNVQGYLAEGVQLLNETDTDFEKLQGWTDSTGYLSDLQKAKVGEDGIEPIAVLTEDKDENGDPVYEQDVDENGNPKFDENGEPVYVYEYEEELDEQGKPVLDADGNVKMKVKMENGEPVKKKKMVIVYYTDNLLKEAVEKTDGALGSANTNLDTAKNSSNETEANRAAAAFEQNRTDAYNGLVDSDKRLQALKDELAEKEKKHATVISNLETAKNDLKTYNEDYNEAIKDSAALSAVLQAVQEKINALEADKKQAEFEEREAELNIISELYNDYKDNTKPGSQWGKAAELFKALVRYYVVHGESSDYVSDFAISGGIKGVSETELSKDKIGYSKTVKENYTSGEGEDENGNPITVYTRSEDATEYDFPSSGTYPYNGNTFSFIDNGIVKSEDPNDLESNGKKKQKNNVLVVKYTARNGEELVERERYFNYKIDSNGDFWFYERNVDVDEYVAIEATAGLKAGFYKYDNGESKEEILVAGEDGKYSSYVVGKEIGEITGVEPTVPYYVDVNNRTEIQRVPTRPAVKETYRVDEDGNLTKQIWYEYMSNTPKVEERDEWKKTYDSEEAANADFENAVNEIKKKILNENGVGYYPGLDKFEKDGVEYTFETVCTNGTVAVNVVHYEMSYFESVGAEVKCSGKEVEGSKIERYQDFQEIIDDNGSMVFVGPDKEGNENTKEYGLPGSTDLVKNELTGRWYNSRYYIDEDGNPVHVYYYSMMTTTYERVRDKKNNEMKEEVNAPVDDKSPDNIPKKISNEIGEKTKKLWEELFEKLGIKGKEREELLKENYIDLGPEGLKNANNIRTKDGTEYYIRTTDPEKVLKQHGHGPGPVGPDAGKEEWSVTVSLVTVKDVDYSKEWVTKEVKCEKAAEYRYSEAQVGNNELKLERIVWSNDLAKNADGSMTESIASTEEYILYKKLKEAKDAVDAAARRAEDLKNNIAKLEKKLASGGELDEREKKLKKELEEAKKAVEVAEKDLQDRWDEYNKLTDVVIDLSRFDRRDDGGGESGPTGGTPSGDSPVIISDAGIPVYPITGGTTPSGVAGVRTGGRASRSGVAGVRVEANNDGDGTTDNRNDVAANKNEVKQPADPDDFDKEEVKNVVKLANNQVPLADKPFEEEFDLNWLWLLVAAAIAIVGIYSYENHRKKVAANEEAKKYKK